MTKGRDAALISIVDDSPINIDILSSVLSGAGFEIAEASDSETFFDQLGHALPDLIILDIKLPGTDGFEICRRLKADAKTSAVPVIFMTGLSDTLDKVRGLEVGALDYITKPFQREELLARVQVHLRLRRLERGLIEQAAELTRSLEELRQVREELQRANEALDGDVKLRTEELRDTNARLELELAEHRRTEAARAALQQEIIDVQRRRLAELSTPLIPITDRIMVMPLIGTMDAERARRCEGSRRRCRRHAAPHRIGAPAARRSGSDHGHPP
jgi:DNA-binding response OmpR family regulator